MQRRERAREEGRVDRRSEREAGGVPVRHSPRGVFRLPLRGAAAVLAAAGVAGVAACGLPGVPALPEAGPAAGPAAVAETAGGADVAGGAAAHAEAHAEAAALLATAEPGPDCFQRHLREAISLNARRLPRYAEWSGGASRPLSRRLIALERGALVPAGWVDSRARRFQDAGVPIGCAEFASMSLTPPLGRTPPAPPEAPYRPGLDADSLAAALAGAYGEGGFPAVAHAADRALHALHGVPEYHCMVRHLVESVWRVAALAPLHQAAAADAGLPSPVPLSELLLRLHLAALPEGARLDADAAPLQQAGVPILCRDVPPIR